jgi:hypothetical protein
LDWSFGPEGIARWYAVGADGHRFRNGAFIEPAVAEPAVTCLTMWTARAERATRVETVTRADRTIDPGPCHDGAVIVRLRPRQLLVAVAVSLGTITFGAIAAGCSIDQASPPATMDQVDAAASLTTNPFIPEDVNIGDCVSSLPRPGCGNEIRGDSHAMITFGVLVAGLTFIGWRIGRSVRRRDATPQGPPA